MAQHPSLEPEIVHSHYLVFDEHDLKPLTPAASIF
jgi:hypothetical protein